jgi:L-rhamnose mutarotase
MTRRVCFALDLNDDPALIAAYEAAHLPGAVWPTVIAGIRASGYEVMEIWRAGDRLILIGEVSDDWPRVVEPELMEADVRWQAAMDAYQRRLPFASENEKWVPMSRIFALDP